MHEMTDRKGNCCWGGVKLTYTAQGTLPCPKCGATAKEPCGKWLKHAAETDELLKQALKRNLALRKALEFIAKHEGLTLLCPDETASPEYQAAYSEGVARGYRGLAEVAQDALKNNPFP